MHTATYIPHRVIHPLHLGAQLLGYLPLPVLQQVGEHDPLCTVTPHEEGGTLLLLLLQPPQLVLIVGAPTQHYGSHWTPGAGMECFGAKILVIVVLVP